MKINIIHKIPDIDHCIADEIQILNNTHNILTIFSCCGHNKGCHGGIAVHPLDVEKMLKLGYEYGKGMFWEIPVRNGYGEEIIYRFPLFKAKSLCTGRHR